MRDESDNGSGNSSKTLVSSYKATQSHNPHEKTQYIEIDNNSTEISQDTNCFQPFFKTLALQNIPFHISQILLYFTYCCQSQQIVKNNYSGIKAFNKLPTYVKNQWRAQEFFSGVGDSTNSVEDTGQRERESGGAILEGHCFQIGGQVWLVYIIFFQTG